MTVSMRVEWDKGDMERRMQEYTNRVHAAMVSVAKYWQAVFEADAKKNASWQDRTANARQSLHAWVQELSRDTVSLYLSHGVDYGVHLETRWAGRYAIIWPTIQKHLDAIRQMLQEIFN